MAEFDFLENPRLMRVPTKKWIENPCERILVPDRDFVYMLEIQDVPVRARDKFIHWRMMTSEEEQTFKVCEQERFWTRSVPFMIGVSAITAVLSRRARYNLWQKAICQYAALTVGRDLGHFTYWYLEHERWAERFMHLQGSTYGEALRRRDCQLQRWYPNGAPPIPRHLLYTRTEPPSSLPPPLPPSPPTQPPNPSPHLITASLQSSELEAQFQLDIDEKYTDYSIEYNSPLFTSSLGETSDLEEEETTLEEEEENHPEVTIPSFSSSSNDDDDDDKDNKSSSSTPTSFPSSSPPAFPSSSPPAFPSSSPPAFPSSSPPAFPSSSPPAFPSSSPPAFPSSSSPPAFPSSSPPAFPSSPVSWDEDDASSHEDEDDERIQRENVLPDDSAAATEDTEEFISPEKEKKRNIYGDIIEDDIQDER